MESIEKNIDKYIDYLKYEKKLSNNTISSYYENLKKFYSHFEKKNIFSCKIYLCPDTPSKK